MGRDEPSLGDLTKQWWRAKKRALLAGTQVSQQSTATDAGNAQRRVLDRAYRDAAYASIPALGRWKQRQDEAAEQREAAEREEILSLPRASVTLDVSGVVSGAWSGELPVRQEQDENGLAVELVVLDDVAPLLGSDDFLGLRLLVPGYTGPGHYDLAAIARSAAGELDATDWEACLGNRDEPYYWVPGDSFGTVDVAPGVLSAHLQMQGAAGDVVLNLQLHNLPS